jgi:hypothetical protein
MNEPTGSDELTRQLERLIERLDTPPRRKDWSDRLAIISSFVNTVIVALLGLYFTESARKSEQVRQNEYQAAQLQLQRAQVRIEELKALTSVAPLLASRDSAQRQVAQMMLDAVNEVGAVPTGASLQGSRRSSPQLPDAPPETASATSAAALAELSVIDRFITLARDARQSEQRRIQALHQIGELAASPNASQETRERAVAAAASIVASPATPVAVRTTAADVIARIQRVTPEQAVAIIGQAPLTRGVSRIIVHHAAESIANFSGEKTVRGIAEFQTGVLGFGNRISWHYAISPDGGVWLGMPLDKPAAHAARYNAGSISVLLFLDGDKELPTAAQRHSLAVVMRALQEKTGLSVASLTAVVLHRDLEGLPSPKSCPGKLILRDSIVAWVRGG